MPPKTTFTKEIICETAFKVALEEGIQDLSARNIAGELKSSTAPIYSYFKSMDELKDQVVDMAMLKLQEYCTEDHTERIFLNMGTGIALFARDYKELFKSIFLKDSKYKKTINKFFRSMMSVMKKDPRFVNMPDKEIEILFYKMWRFTFGLATMISIGIDKQDSKEYIVNSLIDIGGDVIGAALKKMEK